MKILQQLKENHYTESEQQVIDYLLDHLEDLTLLSINDLAKRAILQMPRLFVYVISRLSRVSTI